MTPRLAKVAWSCAELGASVHVGAFKRRGKKVKIFKNFLIFLAGFRWF